MIPVNFPEVNVTYAKDQPEYTPLPVHRTPTGEVTSCWKLSLRERLVLLCTGRLYITQLTFLNPLQPIRPSVDKACQSNVDGEACQVPSDDKACQVPPNGWKCTRSTGHDGPCAAIPE